VTLDFDGRVTSLNPAAGKLLGVLPDEANEKSLVELAPSLAAISVANSEVLSLQGGRRLKASRAEFFDRGFPRSFLLVEELTEELRASEKAAYGKLIRMMSHEINNSVGAVGSLLDSFRGYAPNLGEDDRADFLQAITVAVTRLENLRSFMNGFAEVVRLPPPDRRPTDVKQLVDEILILLRPELDRRRIAVLLGDVGGDPAGRTGPKPDRTGARKRPEERSGVDRRGRCDHPPPWQSGEAIFSD